jgi:hypothetical protein
MRPQTLLPCLLGAAVGAAGWMQALHWKSAAPAQGDDESSARIIALEDEVALLKRENESLRSLAQGGGDFKVEPELITFVEQALGLNFRSSPVIHQIAVEELRGRVQATIESRYDTHGLDSREQAWKLMGLLGAEDRFAPQFALTKSEGARSWFDEESGEGWVTNRFDPQSIPDQAAVVRTLVRILIHQNYPPGTGWPGDEIANSREALHHGTAIAIESRFLARQALATGFTGAQEDQGVRGLLDSLPAYVRGLATFPSSLGIRLASRLMDQEEILSGLKRPPEFTAAYFPAGEEIEKPNPPALPDTPGNQLVEESAGMLGLTLWLEPLGPESAPIADGWRGDRYRLFATSDTDLHLVWDVRLDSERSADSFSEAARSMVSAMAGTENDPAVGEITESPEARFIAVARPAPDVVRFVNATSQEIAKSFIP